MSLSSVEHLQILLQNFGLVFQELAPLGRINFLGFYLLSPFFGLSHLLLHIRDSLVQFIIMFAIL